MLNNTTWWQDAVFYQIYPRSFNDSNGDGIGDIKGIIEKIPYIKDLGVDAVWLNPVYPSPNNDYGYDISDYRNIHPEYGTLDDFDEMLQEFHRYGIRVIMDLVVNHTSTEHSWFKNSVKNPDGPYGNFYIWKDGKHGEMPNNWNSFFGGPAWKYSEERSQYYLHLFDEHQADLNWSNPELRNEIYSIMKWWAARGIDGFRMDVINMISKDPAFPDDTRDVDPLVVLGTPYFVNGPDLHNYLKEMRKEALDTQNLFAIGECPGARFEDVLKLTGYDRNELDAVFQMELMEIDHGDGGKWDIKPWTVSEFAKTISDWQRVLEGSAWPANFFANHDQPRPLSRFGNDNEYRFESASMLATLLLSLTGTPFIYYGEEIGMPNPTYSSISEYRDVDTLNFYRIEKQRGKSEGDLIKTISYMSRDNARSPMQWDSSEQAGFSPVLPWIPVGNRYKEINVEKERSRTRSIISEYKKLISLRKESPALTYGQFRLIKSDDNGLIAFEKNHDEGKFFVFANMGKDEIRSQIGGNIKKGPVQIVYSNYDDFQVSDEILYLRPYEACIMQLIEDSDK